MRHDAGVTLMETMIAMALVGVAALGISHSTVTMMRANRMSQNSTVASSLATSKLEQLTRVDPKTLSGGTDTVVPHELPNWSFTRRWRVDDATDPQVPDGLKRIEVIVGWTDFAARTTSVATFVRDAETGP